MGIFHSSRCCCSAILLFSVGGEGLEKLKFMTFQNETPLDDDNEECAADDKMRGKLGALIYILKETAPNACLLCIYYLIYVSTTVCKKEPTPIHSTWKPGMWDL